MHLLSTGYSACSSPVFNGEMYKIGYGVPARDAWAAFETVRREDPGNAWADCFALADRASSAHYPGSAGRLRVDDRERKVGSSRNRSRHGGARLSAPRGAGSRSKEVNILGTVSCGTSVSS